MKRRKLRIIRAPRKRRLPLTIADDMRELLELRITLHKAMLAKMGRAL